MPYQDCLKTPHHQKRAAHAILSHLSSGRAQTRLHIASCEMQPKLEAWCMFDFDFVGLSKVLSTLFAGAFGVLGLLTKYKHDDGRITKWGAISLAGILVSTLMGVVAQVKEESNRKGEREESARQMLQVITQTQRSVYGLERALQPIEAPALSVAFNIDCRSAHFMNLCAAASTYFKHRRYLMWRDSDASATLEPFWDSIWKEWPVLKPDPPRLRVELIIMKENREFERYRPDWRLQYIAPPLREATMSTPSMDVENAPYNGFLPLRAHMLSPIHNENYGFMKSIIDLDRASIFVSMTPDDYGHDIEGLRPAFVPTRIALRFSNGRQIDVGGKSFQSGPSMREETDKSYRATITVPRE